MREREGESSESSSRAPYGSFWNPCHQQSVPGVDRAPHRSVEMTLALVCGPGWFYPLKNDELCLQFSK